MDLVTRMLAGSHTLGGHFLFKPLTILNMKNVLKALHQRPIAVYPVYIDLTGSIAGGLLLSQLLYWLEKVDREIWKTDAEILAETRLTQTEFKNAKKAIAALPFMSVTKRGVPPKTYYAVDWDGLGLAIESLISSVTYQLNRRLSTSQRGGNLPNGRSVTYDVIHRLHSETTTKNTLEPQKEISIQVNEEFEGMKLIVHDTIPSTQKQTPTPNSATPPSPKKAKREKTQVYKIFPPTLEEVIPLMYAKLVEKKRVHTNIVDCWNWANLESEKFILHHEGKGWKFERLNGAIATWVNGSISYGTVTKPCPIQYKGNPANAQPAPTKVYGEERPVLTQHDIEYSQAAFAGVEQMFKQMGGVNTMFWVFFK